MRKFVFVVVALLQCFSSSVQSLDPLRGRQQPDKKADPPAASVVVTTRNMAIAGKIGAILQKLKNAKFKSIRVGLAKAFYVTDVAWLGAIGWLTEPLAHQWFRFRHGYVQEYTSTWLAFVAQLVGQLGKVASLIYTCDMLSVIATKLGFVVPPGLNDRIARLSYTLWATFRLRQAKKWWLRRVLKETDDELSVKATIVNYALDSVMAVCLVFFVQDIFQVTMGRGLSSVFAVGGISGLVISLASKDLAQMLISGLVINAGDKFVVGDYVQLGDGTAGTVSKLGAFEMQIRGNDGVVTRIPNGQIVHQRVQNLSRTKTCQVKQTLWFKYEDIDKLPAVMDAIKEEIEKSCPALIKDGSRPFRAVWTAFQNDHLESVVDAHFNLKPIGDEYHNNRQVVLQSVARAAERNGVEFAIPNYICKNEDISAQD